MIKQYSEGIKDDDMVTMVMKNLIVMLPTLDEEYGLKEILPRIPLARLEELGWATEVWVIDGGSNDLTVEIAKEHGCEVFTQAGFGKGAAMRTGFSKFLSANQDALIMLDADGTYDPSEIPEFVKLLHSNEVVIGNRLQGNIEPNAMTNLNYFGNHILTWFASILYGVATDDLCTGYWGFTRTAIAKLQLNSMRFEIEAEMFASCVKEDIKIISIPITYRARIGQAKLGSVIDGWMIFKKLLVRRIFPTPVEAITGRGNLDMD